MQETFDVTLPDPAHFAAQWISHWNARDAEAVLAQYADDVVFTSPTALRLVPHTGGTVRGKDALRSYWTHVRSKQIRIFTSCWWASTRGSTPSLFSTGTSWAGWSARC